jgi:copper chaperone CopZ
MKLISKILVATTMLLSANTINAQIKDSKTEVVKIYGNCEMCKSKIEKAGSKKNVSMVEWNQETAMATITYDEKITNKDEILKKIAAVGYDSEKFRAPDKVYNNLHHCCQYERSVNTLESVCTMCHTDSDKAGKCTKCGMEMTKKEK